MKRKWKVIDQSELQAKFTEPCMLEGKKLMSMKLYFTCSKLILNFPVFPN